MSRRKEGRAPESTDGEKRSKGDDDVGKCIFSRWCMRVASQNCFQMISMTYRKTSIINDIGNWAECVSLYIDKRSLLTSCCLLDAFCSPLFVRVLRAKKKLKKQLKKPNEKNIAIIKTTSDHYFNATQVHARKNEIRLATREKIYVYRGEHPSF